MRYSFQTIRRLGDSRAVEPKARFEHARKKLKEKRRGRGKWDPLSSFSSSSSFFSPFPSTFFHCQGGRFRAFLSLLPSITLRGRCIPAAKCSLPRSDKKMSRAGLIEEIHLPLTLDPIGRHNERPSETREYSTSLYSLMVKVGPKFSYSPMSSIHRSSPSSMANLNSFSAAILACLVGVMSYFAAMVGVTLSPPGSLSPLWPGCACLVAVLLCAPQKVWPALMAAGFAGFFLYNVRIGLSVRTTSLLFVADTVEILVAALGISYTLGKLPRLNSIKRLALYSLFAVILAPASGAFVGAAAVGVNYWAMWRIGFFSEALALLTVTPAILGFVGLALAPVCKSVGYYYEAVLMFVGVVVLGYFIFVASDGPSHPALLYSLVPFLLWAALRYGSVGISTSMLVVAFLSIWGTVHARGLFTGSTPLSKVLSLQLFLLVATIPFTTLAALVEESKETEHALRDSESRERAKAKELETVLDAVPVAVLIASDSECKRITSNRAGRELLRLQPGANASKSSPSDQQPEFRILSGGVEVPTEHLPIQRAAATATHVFDVSESLVFPDGTQRSLISNAAPLIGEDGRPYGAVAALLDVTERDRAVKALRESEERFRLVANSAPVMIWMSGLNKKPTYFNQLWLDFTGLSEIDLLNGLAGTVHPEDYRQGLDVYLRAFDLRQPFRKECRLRRHDGQYRWVLDIGVPRFQRDGSFAGYIGSCIDVTDQKAAQETLAGMTRKLIEAQEQERARIARELHDDINQRLAMLAVELEQLGDDPSEVESRVQELRKQTIGISDDVQALSHELHSSKLDYLGAVGGLGSWCKEFGGRHGIQIDYRHDVRNTLPLETGLCLFRVVQEALHNVVKHSGAKRVEVELAEDSGEVHVLIRDLGKGFDLETAEKGRGLGLTSMRERVRLVNGTIEIESKPMIGTTIRVHVPFPSDAISRRAAS